MNELKEVWEVEELQDEAARTGMVSAEQLAGLWERKYFAPAVLPALTGRASVCHTSGTGLI